MILSSKMFIVRFIEFKICKGIFEESCSVIITIGILGFVFLTNLTNSSRFSLEFKIIAESVLLDK